MKLKEANCFFLLQFVFVDDKDLKAKLLEEIDESQLPEIYGGKLALVPIESY